MRHKWLAVLAILVMYSTISIVIAILELKLVIRPNVLVNIVKESQVVNNLPKFLETSLIKIRSEDPKSEMMTRALIKSIDPQDALKQIDGASVPVYKYITGKAETFSYLVDLQTYKTNLKANLDSSSYSAQVLSDIPDLYTLTVNKTFTKLKNTYHILNIVFYVCIAVSLFLILLLCYLGRNFWPAILRWNGWGLLLPSGTILILNFISKSLPSIFTSSYSNAIDPEILNTFKPLIEAVNNHTLQSSFIISGSIFLFGVLLILLSYILPHPPQPDPKQTLPNVK